VCYYYFLVSCRTTVGRMRRNIHVYDRVATGYRTPGIQNDVTPACDCKRRLCSRARALQKPWKTMHGAAAYPTYIFTCKFNIYIASPTWNNTPAAVFSVQFHIRIKSRTMFFFNNLKHDYPPPPIVSGSSMQPLGARLVLYCYSQYPYQLYYYDRRVAVCTYCALGTRNNV